MPDLEKTTARRATKAEVLADLDKAQAALVTAAVTMTRRYGRTDHVIQLCGAAAMISKDWAPAIEGEHDD